MTEDYRIITAAMFMAGRADRRDRHRICLRQNRNPVRGRPITPTIGLDSRGGCLDVVAVLLAESLFRKNTDHTDMQCRKCAFMRNMGMLLPTSKGGLRLDRASFETGIGPWLASPFLKRRTKTFEFMSAESNS